MFSQIYDIGRRVRNAYAFVRQQNVIGLMALRCGEYIGTKMRFHFYGNFVSYDGSRQVYA